jgi:hypothetical protein
MNIDTLRILCPGAKWYKCGETWESIRLPEGYEKPSKEEFEAKLKELIDAQPLKDLRTKRNTLLEQTDRYAITDFPYATEDDKQARLTQRQALRDLPSLVTPLEGGSMRLWVTNQNGSLQVGDSLVLSNTAGYFTKGEPAVVTIKNVCDFSESTTETYYSNIVSVTQKDEVSYWTSNAVSHYVGNVVSYYSNVVIYDGVNVYTNVQIEEYSNLEAAAQSHFVAIMKSNTSPIEIEGYTPVLKYSNITSDLYDANVHVDYTKVIESPASNVVEYSNITSSAYEALNSNLIVTPAYTSFYHEASNTSIRVGAYAALTPEQRTEYTIQSVPAVTSNLQSFYTPQTKTTVHELRYLDASGTLTDQANAVWKAAQVECTFPTS